MGTMLHAQVVEWHRPNKIINKDYMKYIDSIVYVPAQDWSIKLQVDSFYTDKEEKIHVVASATIGPNAHLALAAIGNNLTREHLVNDSVETIRLEAGTTQIIDLVVPNPQERCNIYAVTKNNYNTWGDIWDYYMQSVEVDYQYYMENKGWSPWFSSKAEWVAAGYDAAAWPLGDAQKTTCTYTYSLYWAGDDPGLPIYYRKNLLDSSIAQFKIDNWGSGVPLIIDYNTFTHNCQVASQYCTNNSNYGAVTISDISYWQGTDYYASFPCTYNPETGLFVLNVAYWVAEGSFGYGPETCQVAGFYIPDYSIEAQYIGVLTNEKQQAFAQIALNSLGVDAEKAVAMVVSASDDATAVADALAEGEVTGTDLVIGYNNIAIEEGMTGELQVVVVSVSEGAAMDIKSFKFEYYEGGTNPWKSLGMGLYTDGIIPSMYNLSSETYEVEILESNETPGLYRVVKPYGDAWPYASANQGTPADYLEIDATDAEGVLVMPQMLGVNVEGGDTELGFASMGAYYYNAGQATLEQLKEMGYLGKVSEGVIKLPTFANGEEGTNSYMEYQGVVYYGSKAYYGCEGFKVVLPEAVASQENAPAKIAASKFARSIKRIDRTPIDKKAKRINPFFRLVNFKK